MRVALTYALAVGGEASFELYVSPDIDDDQEIAKFFEGRRFVIVYLGYTSPQVTKGCQPGFGSSVFFEIR